MRQKVNVLRHVGVLLLTIIIFTLGVFIGGDVEQMRVQNLYTSLQQQDLEYQQVVTEGNYLNYVVDLKEKGEDVDCQTIEGAYFTSIENLDNSRIKLENYINTAQVKEEEYQRLKDHYSNLQIEYWILANKINMLCDGSMNPILYFYEDKKSCPSCEDQGVHLDYVKQKLKDNVLVFSIDAQKTGVIQLLAQRYGIYDRELPALVINENVYGFSSNEEIFKILCDDGLEDNVCQN